MLIHATTDNDIYPPLFGASQRSFGLSRGLARRHAVRVLCVVPNRNRAPRSQRVEGVELERRRVWYTSLAWRLEQGRLAPLFLASRGHHWSAESLLDALPGPAAVLACDLNLVDLLDARGAALKVYTAHNVEYDHFRMVKSNVAAAGFWAGQMRRLEARAVERSDLTVVCSEEDASRMTELYGARRERLLVTPNGYDETRIRPPEGTERARARQALGIGEREYLALFLGSDTPFNREGLDRLVKLVLPSLAADGFRLLVVGSVARTLPARREPWLLVHEETSELAPLLHAADCGLNPVTTGGGSNVKLPTYLGAGLAVVTTDFGLRGYPGLRPWVTVAEPERMAEALRERPAGWRARGLARPPAVEELAWGRLGERLGERFEEWLTRAFDRAPSGANGRHAAAPADAATAGGGSG